MNGGIVFYRSKAGPSHVTYHVTHSFGDIDLGLLLYVFCDLSGLLRSHFGFGVTLSCY